MVATCKDCGIKYTEKLVKRYNVIDEILCWDCYHKRRVKMNGRTCDCHVCKPIKRKK